MSNQDSFKNPSVYLVLLFIIYTIGLVSTTFIIILIGDLAVSAALSMIFWVLFTLFFFVLLRVLSNRISTEIEEEIEEILKPQPGGKK